MLIDACGSLRTVYMSSNDVRALADRIQILWLFVVPQPARTGRFPVSRFPLDAITLHVN